MTQVKELDPHIAATRDSRLPRVKVPKVPKASPSLSLEEEVMRLRQENANLRHRLGQKSDAVHRVSNDLPASMDPQQVEVVVRAVLDQLGVATQGSACTDVVPTAGNSVARSSRSSPVPAHLKPVPAKPQNKSLPDYYSKNKEFLLGSDTIVCWATLHHAQLSVHKSFWYWYRLAAVTRHKRRTLQHWANQLQAASFQKWRKHAYARAERYELIMNSMKIEEFTALSSHYMHWYCHYKLHVKMDDVLKGPNGEKITLNELMRMGTAAALLMIQTIWDESAVLNEWLKEKLDTMKKEGAARIQQRELLKTDPRVANYEVRDPEGVLSRPGTPLRSRPSSPRCSPRGSPLNSSKNTPGHSPVTSPNATMKAIES